MGTNQHDPLYSLTRPTYLTSVTLVDTQKTTFRGCLLLASWRKERDLPRWRAGAIFGINPSQLARYEKGQRPSADLMEQMEEGSKGEIPIASWFERVPIPADDEKPATKLASAV